MGVGARNLVGRVPTHLLVAASAWGSRVVTAVTGLGFGIDVEHSSKGLSSLEERFVVVLADGRLDL